VFQPLANRPVLQHCALTWRQLYEGGHFFQRELVSESTLASDARKRTMSWGRFKRQAWERWDEVGAVRPVLFSKSAYMSGMTMPAIDADEVVFRDEQSEFRAWETYAWDAYGHPHVSAMFSPWQLLQLPDVLDGGNVSVSLEVLLRNSGRDEWAESLRWYFEEQQETWSQLQSWWDPTLRVLVRLQNRYWPFIRGRVNLLTDTEGCHYDPEERREFDPQAVLTEMGLADGDIAKAYAGLARSGHRLEPGDDMYLLRQMTPRGYRQRFEGAARLAQDFYDAAEISGASIATSRATYSMTPR
jgi:hypothetical protein